MSVATAAILAGAPLAAFAQEETMATAEPDAPAVLMTPEQRIAELEAQLAALADQVADLKQATGAQLRAVRETQEAVTVKLDNGRPTIATGDGRFSASLRGVMHLDTAYYDQDDAGPLTTDFRRGSFGDAVEATRARDLNSGANFRRARIGIEGKAFGDFDYGLIGEFGGSGIEEQGRINDFYVQYSGIDNIRLKAGAWAPPTGLEDAASSNGSLFVERASPAETVRGIGGGDGRTGIGILSNGDNWNLSGVVTGQVIGTQNFDEQVAFLGRAAFVPFRRDDALVHVGLNTTVVIDPADAGPDVTSNRYGLRLRDRPELRVDGTRLVDTGTIDADGLVSVGIELGAQKKNFYVQGEYYNVEIQRRNSALSDPEFNGWYVQGSWILTGEARRYATTNAGFDGPRVEPDKVFSLDNKTWGVWELGLRYSNLDLNDNEGSATVLPVGSIRGGEQQIWTLGLNWYLNNTVRLMFQAQNIDVDRLSPGGTAFGSTPTGITPPAGAQIGQELQTYNIRTQVAF